ncbi:MAG TPA: RNA polymerase Rpb4 family protein [Candidatus Thermoplasmatota archaeon]|jgi:DNA-directed RNA polymerase subunit F|nr:RNA polymerase Rpb4 family protein [Candidatus Thermoplasmatota archaeon]
MPPQESVTEGRLLTLSEVRELLEEAERTRGELSYEQKLALDHARSFALKLSGAKARELVERLRKVSDKVSEQHAVKMADLLPTHPDDVRVIFAKERFQLEKDEMDKILETVQSYL